MLCCSLRQYAVAASLMWFTWIRSHSCTCFLSLWLWASELHFFGPFLFHLFTCSRCFMGNYCLQNASVPKWRVMLKKFLCGKCVTWSCRFDSYLLLALSASVCLHFPKAWCLKRIINPIPLVSSAATIKEILEGKMSCSWGTNIALPLRNQGQISPAV